ncbi:MAG: dUTP diphosphatase [Candidatus Woesearchaeota archaeon]|jgi:dUTP pyrophosphatase|nr:dUTP diphosphatase [Candidatus Woesearchaeota archaeon]|tara:strand:- start:652 stop:1086 length:435 start_codon:yes stop_codon:yes gene_type:complete
MITVKIQKIKDNAVVPSYAHKGDAGVDLYSTEDYVLSPGNKILVSTGIKIALPIGYEAQVRPKSGLALKHGLSIVNTPGTIDAGYRGEVGVIVINHGQDEYKIEKGNKIAQMVFNKIEEVNFEESGDLDDTSRGEGGFGSTTLK